MCRFSQNITKYFARNRAGIIAVRLLLFALGSILKIPLDFEVQGRKIFPVLNPSHHPQAVGGNRDTAFFNMRNLGAK